MTPERAADISAFGDLRELHAVGRERLGRDEAHAALKEWLRTMSEAELVDLLAGAMDWVDSQ